ncbi:unnamed protein product [Angiostrongylus costaricensis]|uniref:Nuclear pore complex protein n=1 Tax=Angiostrongylus costaricensis TaxID=334426 RepID=A0A158PMH5_ANGCS|nr:unnamed protein product [Angiostrongylus costaricensis]
MESVKKRERDVLPKLETLMEDMGFYKGKCRTTNRTLERCVWLLLISPESRKEVARVSAWRTNEPALDEAELKNIGAKLRYLLSDYPSLVKKVYRDEMAQSFFPDSEPEHQNGRMQGIAFLTKHGRICFLTFQRIVFTIDLVTVKEAGILIISFVAILVCRWFSNGVSEDASMGGTVRFDDTVGILYDPTLDIVSRLGKWSIIKCWLLMESKYAVEKQMFQCCKDLSEDSADRIARFVVDTYVEPTWFDSDGLPSLAALDSKDIIHFLTKLSEGFVFFMNVVEYWWCQFVNSPCSLGAIHSTTQYMANLLRYLSARVDTFAKENHPNGDTTLI